MTSSASDPLRRAFEGYPQTSQAPKESELKEYLTQHDIYPVQIPEKFQYSPLDTSRHTFRLLQVVPSTSSSIIICSLHEFAIEEAPSYNVLSYTWDIEPSFENLVICNGKKMGVGQNVWDFLFQYQQRVEDGNWIWIDSICIDQQSILERNHQVAQMRDVYSRTANAFVWLGTDQETEQAL